MERRPRACIVGPRDDDQNQLVVWTSLVPLGRGLVGDLRRAALLLGAGWARRPRGSDGCSRCRATAGLVRRLQLGRRLPRGPGRGDGPRACQQVGRPADAPLADDRLNASLRRPPPFAESWGLTLLGVSLLRGTLDQETPALLLAIEPWFVLGGLAYAGIALSQRRGSDRGAMSH